VLFKKLYRHSLLDVSNAVVCPTRWSIGFKKADRKVEVAIVSLQMIVDLVALLNNLRGRT